MLPLSHVLSNYMLDRGALPCLDGSPTTNACHIQAVELIRCYNQVRAGRKLSDEASLWFESCLITCPIVQDSYYGQGLSSEKRIAAWTQIDSHFLRSEGCRDQPKSWKEGWRQDLRAESKKIVTREVQSVHQDALAARVFAIVREGLSKTGEVEGELTLLCDRLSRSGQKREIFPKMAGIVWMIHNLRAEPNSPPLLLKMKHGTTYLGEHIGDRWHRYTSNHENDERAAIVIEGESSHQPLEGEPDLEQEEVASFLLEVSASFQASKQPELLPLLGPKLAAIQAEYFSRHDCQCSRQCRTWV